MLKVEIIGNLGADPEIKESNGNRFVAMRVAHTTKYKDQNDQPHERTIWVDVIMNDTESKVLPFLKAGTKVFIRGNADLRVYSSPKDRCMKAGLTISAFEIELCGGSSDLVPRELIAPEVGTLHKVTKFYMTDLDTSKWKSNDVCTMVDKQGRQYQVVKGGWTTPVENPDESQNG